MPSIKLATGTLTAVTSEALANPLTYGRPSAETPSTLRRNRTVEGTVLAIYETLRDSPTPLSRLEIARAIQRRKTPHLIQIIEEMVRKGWLTRTQTAYHNGVVVYLYAAIPHEGQR